MTFTDAESAYLASQRLGRLATIGPDGSPQVKPAGFRYNPGLGTIDVSGFNMAASQKFRNVRRNGQAALVVDDIASAGPWRGASWRSGAPPTR
jgi:pyridoxamine 5'-phosphate oxidase family protein